MRNMITPSQRGPGRMQLLALATGAGLAAAGLAYFGLARQTQGATVQEQRPVAVVVAACGIPARRPLTLSLLRVRHLPASDVPGGSVATPEELAGQVTTAEVAPGQPVTRGLVTPRTATAGLAWTVAPSRRAVSVALDPESGIAGLLEPGDHVDVLATFEAGDGQAVTRTILQNARLLALGTRTEATAPDAGGSDEKPATGATLEVTPPEAQALAMAAARGKLQLALRGLDDVEQPPIPALTEASTSAGAWHAKPLQEAKPTQQIVGATQRGTPTVGAQHAAPLHPAPPGLGVGGQPAPTTTLPRVTIIRGTETTTVTLGE